MEVSISCYTSKNVSLFVETLYELSFDSLDIKLNFAPKQANKLSVLLHRLQDLKICPQNITVEKENLAVSNFLEPFVNSSNQKKKSEEEKITKEITDQNILYFLKDPKIEKELFEESWKSKIETVITENKMQVKGLKDSVSKFFERISRIHYAKCSDMNREDIECLLKTNYFQGVLKENNAQTRVIPTSDPEKYTLTFYAFDNEGAEKVQICRKKAKETFGHLFKIVELKGETDEHKVSKIFDYIKKTFLKNCIQVLETKKISYEIERVFDERTNKHIVFLLALCNSKKNLFQLRKFIDNETLSLSIVDFKLQKSDTVLTKCEQIKYFSKISTVKLDDFSYVMMGKIKYLTNVLPRLFQSDFIANIADAHIQIKNDPSFFINKERAEKIIKNEQFQSQKFGSWSLYQYNSNSSNLRALYKLLKEFNEIVHEQQSSVLNNAKQKEQEIRTAETPSPINFSFADTIPTPHPTNLPQDETPNIEDEYELLDENSSEYQHVAQLIKSSSLSTVIKWTSPQLEQSYKSFQALHNENEVKESLLFLVQGEESIDIVNEYKTTGKVTGNFVDRLNLSSENENEEEVKKTIIMCQALIENKTSKIICYYPMFCIDLE